MKISVIIPVYSRDNYIKRAVQSVLKQTRPADEIIVIDDGSTDRTGAILNDFASHIKVYKQDNHGVSAARNKGIQLAAGEWIAFLDSDDEWLPDKLERAESFHRANPDLLIFQTEEIWIRNGMRVNPRKKHQKFSGWIFKQSLPLCIVSPSAVVIHKNVFDWLGLFDEKLPVCEDYDLWLRILREYPIGLDPKAGIIKYGGHKDQLSRKYWGMDRYRVTAIEKQLADPSLSTDYRIAALKQILKKLKVLMNGMKKREKPVADLEEKFKRHQAELAALESDLLNS